MSFGRLFAVVVGVVAVLILGSSALGSAATRWPITASDAGTVTPTPPPTPGSPTTGSPPPSTTPPSGRDAAWASQIALDKVGSGTVTAVERDDDAPAVWEVDVAQGSTEQRVQIDAATGSVIAVTADNEGTANEGTENEGTEPAETDG